MARSRMFVEHYAGIFLIDLDGYADPRAVIVAVVLLSL